MTRISQTLGIVQCAFHATGAIPASLQDAAKTSAKFPGVQSAPPMCGETQTLTDRVTTGGQPANPGDVTYNPKGGAQVSVCGNFRRAHNANDRLEGYFPLDGVYPQLNEARPAGVHCYEIQLVPPG